MKYLVTENCIGCGMCAGTCPAVFQMGEDGLAKAAETDVDNAEVDAANAAMDSCPVSAIEQVKES